MTARTRRSRGSLESSWGDAEYSSDAGASIHSASDEASEVDLDESDREVAQQPQASTTALPQDRRSQPVTPLKQQQTSNLKNSVSERRRKEKRPTTTPPMARSTPRMRGSRQIPSDIGGEPDFIMPSIDGSPARRSYMQQEKSYQSLHTQSPRTSRVPSRTMSGGTPSKRSTRAHEVSEDEGPGRYIKAFVDNIVWPFITYVWAVLAYSMRHVVTPFLGLAFGVAILGVVGYMFTGMLRSSISTALMAPVCMIPGSSYIIPACASTSSADHFANFEDLIDVQTHFEDILESSKDTSTLPSTIKNSELAIRDLRTLVRYSKLPSRNELDNEFHYFVLTAKEASEDLSRYNSRIGAAMDRVIATNTWTIHVLEGIEQKEASAGALSRLIGSMTSPFVAGTPTLQKRIFDQYVLHLGKNKEEINGLIDTAQALLMVLNNLDERLDTIYSMVTNDDHTITKNQEELLSSLWTKLGGNRDNVKSNAQQLNLLKNIAKYRKRALLHVSETLLKLQEIQADLENLREGVSAPEILGYRSELPPSYHIGLIEKGVERLRVSRSDSRRVESEVYRKMVGGAGEGEKMRELPAPVVTVRAK